MVSEMSDLRQRLDQVSSNVRNFKDSGIAIYQAQAELTVAEDLEAVTKSLTVTFRVSVGLGMKNDADVGTLSLKSCAIRDSITKLSSSLNLEELKSLSKDCKRVENVLAERNRHAWTQIKSEVTGEGQKSLLEAAARLGVEGTAAVVLTVDRIAHRQNPTLEDVQTAKDLRTKIHNVVTELTGNDPEITDFVKKLTTPTGIALGVVDHEKYSLWLDRKGLRGRLRVVLGEGT